MLRLRVLGGFSLEDQNGSALRPLPKRRAEAVLAVLAVSADRGCTRERLLALLWPESDEARARHGLRDALHAIRHALGHAAVPASGRTLRLDPAIVESDVHVFATACAQGRPADAVRVYAGPLLDGFHVDDAPEFERWVDAERTRLARENGEALEHLASAEESRGAWEAAVGWWARAVEHDRLNSHFVLRQMRALTSLGDRANALKVGESHSRRLREELDLDPDSGILAGIERIRRGDTGATRHGLSTPVETPRLEVPSPERSDPLPATPVRAPTRRRRGFATRLVATAVLLAAILWMGRWISAGQAASRRALASIAVLPFRNLSSDSSNAHFAAGLHDELLTQLGKVSALRVVGRTSVSEYSRTAKPLRQVGQELGVGSIVEGSVQVDGDRLRIIVRLVDLRTQEDRWSERYDRRLGDAFAVQSDIARQIVAAVGATLTSAEAGSLALAPTENQEAYQLYLQGRDYAGRPGMLRQNLEIAQQLHEHAIALDSNFALAHASLALVHHSLFHLKYDRSPARLQRAEHEADVALRLAPDLPEAHLAVGRSRYLARKDFHGALAQFNLGLQRAPNDGELWTWIGMAHRGLGDWDSAIAAFTRSRHIDPRDTRLLQALADAYHFTHRYREAIATYRQAIELAPDVVQTRLSLAWSYVLWTGQLDTLRVVLEALPLDGDPGLGGAALRSNWVALAMMERRPDSALSLLRGTQRDQAGEPDVLSSLHWTMPAYRLRGDTAAVRATLDSATRSVEAVLQVRPDDGYARLQHAEILAQRGQREEALRELQSVDQRQRGTDIFGDLHIKRAGILMLTGQLEAAVAELEHVLVHPSLVTAHFLRLDPWWDPLTRDPRFQVYLTKHATPRS